jgi:lipopolysaccharide/colanic/teichoic acid biosynthesis glycosyltransferase
MHRDAKSDKYSLEKRYMRDGFLDIPIECEVYTRIGRLLERFQLVECPQLLNILFTSLSLVGNRPLPLANLDGLKKYDGWERRFDSPAGMTGITQIVGKLNQQPAQRLELEGMYSFIYNNGNILKCDLLILINTVKLVLFKKYISITEAKDIINRCK